jgi:predicted membrane protein
MAEPVTAAAAAAIVASAASTSVTTAASVGFFASLGLFIAGWSIAILAVLIVLGILFEHNGARGWSVFAAMLVAGVAYISFNVSLVMLAVGAVGYIVVGLIWSFWRYKRHAQKVVERNKGESAITRERALVRLHPKEMLGTITAWIMIWPFSMVENLVGDILNLIQDLVRKVFRGVYHRIYDSAVAALK